MSVLQVHMLHLHINRIGDPYDIVMMTTVPEE